MAHCVHDCSPFGSPARCYPHMLVMYLPILIYVINVINPSSCRTWFEPNRWGGGGYLEVHKSVGSMIDWYNVQFYQP